MPQDSPLNTGNDALWDCRRGHHFMAALSTRNFRYLEFDCLASRRTAVVEWTGQNTCPRMPSVRAAAAAATAAAATL